MKYKCGICGKNIKDDLIVYVDHTENHIVEEIQLAHPDWAKDDSLCHKCIDYYREQMRGDSSAG